MHPLIETHRDAILDIARRYGFTNVRVFGSMVRGDADENSDVDLLVTLPPGVSGLASGGLLMDVQDITGRKVDILTDGGLNPALRDMILKEAQAL
ncbi:MAG: nucleotidyltransferase family protein [Gammaproteobacteria bacterium]